MVLNKNQKVGLILSPIVLGILIYILNSVINIVDNWKIFGIALVVIVSLQIFLSLFVRFMYKFLIKEFSVITTMILIYIFSVTIFFLFKFS